MENNFKNYEPLSCNLDNIASQLCLSKNCSIYLNIPPPLCVGWGIEFGNLRKKKFS